MDPEQGKYNVSMKETKKKNGSKSVKEQHFFFLE